MAKGKLTIKGDIHSQVEDTQVPASLKALVFAMGLILIGTMVTVTAMLQRAGLLDMFMIF